jgi:hypothetical protein
MAERPTTIRLAPGFEAAVRALSKELGITFNATVKVLLSEALNARGLHPSQREQAQSVQDRAVELASRRGQSSAED